MYTHTYFSNKHIQCILIDQTDKCVNSMILSVWVLEDECFKYLISNKLKNVKMNKQC